MGTRSTLYKIAKGRDASVATAVIGENYKGVLVHDGWSVYDQLVKCEHQTCLADLIRRCNDLIEQHSEKEFAAHPLPIRIFRELLGDSLVLESRRNELTTIGFQRKVDQLWRRLDELVLPGYQLPADERLAKHLSNHCDQLFTFLTETKYPIDATKLAGRTSGSTGCSQPESLGWQPHLDGSQSPVDSHVDHPDRSPTRYRNFQVPSECAMLN